MQHGESCGQKSLKDLSVFPVARRNLATAGSNVRRSFSIPFSSADISVGALTDPWTLAVHLPQCPFWHCRLLRRSFISPLSFIAPSLLLALLSIEANRRLPSRNP